MTKNVVLSLIVCVSLWCSPAATDADWTHGPVTLGPSVLLMHDIPYAGHGVVGDEVLLFNVEIQPPDLLPAETRIGVYLRHLKREVGVLEPVAHPPDDPKVDPSWTIPMSMRIESYASQGMRTSGRIHVLEVGLTHPDQPPLFQRLIEYDYEYSPRKGFSHQVPRVGYLPRLSSPPGELPDGVVLPENFDVIADRAGVRHVVVADAIVGTVWSAEISDLTQWHLQLFAQELAPTPLTRVCEYERKPIIGFCGYARGPEWTTEHYVQAMWQPIPEVDLSAGPFGITYIGLTGKVAINNAGTGAIYQIDAEVLLDSRLEPFTDSKPLETLLSPIPGVSDFQGSLVWDRWHPRTPWLYWQRIISNAQEKYFPIYRVNVLTGEVQFIAESIMLFDHPSMISVLPTRRLPLTSLVTSNTQERNMALTNRLLTESRLVGPSVVTETRILVPPWER